MHLRLAAQLAWSNTTNQWQRLLVRSLGIMFAVVLMFMQTGFRNALFDSNVRLVERKIDCDIVIRTASRYMLSSGQTMPREVLTATRSVTGIASVEPLYIENVASEFRPLGGYKRRIRVFAFDVTAPEFAPFELQHFAPKLQAPLTGLADRQSKPMYRFPDHPSELPEDAFGELRGLQIRLVGLFDMGIDFSNDGNLIVDPHNFARYFEFRGDGDPLSAVDYGIASCEPGVDPRMMVARLREVLGDSVLVDTRDDFLASERAFWGKSTPIGLIFWVGTLIGFVVGTIICYQVLATDIADHMGEFATLKAMGYRASFFAMVVICQALLLSAIAFVPGMVLAFMAFQVINSWTGLELYLNASRLGLVLGLTVSMCVLSGLIALRKLLTADPANLF